MIRANSVIHPACPVGSNVLVACALALLLASATPLYAAEPPPGKPPKPQVETLRAAHKTAAVREPIDKTGAIIIPRENCGTWWTKWENNPDGNPCPANCERGERLDVKQRKDGSKVQYQANYRCFLPELVVNQPPAIARQLAAGGLKGQNCGTFWTTRQSDPNADVNPCPANCERGELNWVKRGMSDGKSHYEMNYRCYMAGSMVKAPAPSAAKTGTDRPADSEKATRTAAQSISLTAPPLRMTGRWPAAMANTVVGSDAIRMTGRWPIQSAANVTLTAGAIQMTGRWPAAMASTVVNGNAIRMTGRWSVAFPQVTITTDAIRMTGRSPP